MTIKDILNIGICNMDDTCKAIESGKSLQAISDALDIYNDEQVIAMVRAAASIIAAATEKAEG